MTHLEFLKLFGNFTNEGQESSFKLPNTTNTQNVGNNNETSQHNDNMHKISRFNLLRLVLVLMIIGLYCCTSKRNRENFKVPENDTIQVADTIISVMVQSDSIKKYSSKMKKFFKYTEAFEIDAKWILPFNLSDRSDLKMISIISDYGTYRSGHVKGHRHSGVDIVPIGIKDTIFVYPLNEGIVCLVRPIAPNKTIIIKHKLINGSIIYSSYIHLKEIYVENDQEVNHNTKIGVLYTKSEARKYNGNYDHLHLEIKKRIDDYCCASWLCMSQEELSQYFYNPLDFLKKNLNK